MKRMRLRLGICLLTFSIILVSVKIILAQPKAKKVCMYPKDASNYDKKLEDLKANQSVCFEDSETLAALNSASSSFLGLVTYQGGIYGTFTDDKNKIHLIIITLSNEGIIDLTSNKTYIIKDKNMVKKWYDAVNKTLSKVDSLK